jgi:hypothetical protein
VPIKRGIRLTRSDLIDFDLINRYRWRVMKNNIKGIWEKIRLTMKLQGRSVARAQEINEMLIAFFSFETLPTERAKKKTPMHISEPLMADASLAPSGVSPAIQVYESGANFTKFRTL